MRRLAAIVLPLAVVLVVVLWRAEGTTPRPRTAPATAFSSERAMSALRSTIVDRVPHPIGSRANARVRARIETQFRALGYDTVAQRRFVCNASANCGTVENVIARRRGTASRGDVVLLAAHYDSVPAAPGASDDGVGVATMLEVARAIRSEHFLNRVEFLIDDGEEAGLLGAEAFVADAALSGDVAAVINVEMRGTHGASNMFETSRGNRWLIRQLAHALPHPQTTSLFSTAYDLLPNDTDVTIFKREGIAAVNFAAVRGVSWYHTPLDDLEHVSARTLQHHGDNVLATLRAFADTDLDARSRTDAVWFDFLGFFLIWWPQEWTIWIGVASLAVLLFAARRMPPRTMTFGVLATFIAILIAAVAGVAIAWIARLHSAGVNFAATTWPSITAMWLTGIAAAVLAMSFFRRRKDAEAMLYGVGFVWHAIAIALALTLPGTSYLFLVPAVALTVCAVSRADELVMAAVTSTVAAIVFFPVTAMLYDTLGNALMPALAVLIGVFATLSAPLFARARTALAIAVLAIGCAVFAAAQPAFTSAQPRRLSLAYVDDAAAGSPQWITERTTPALRRAAPFQSADPRLTPWNPSRASWAAPAPRYGAPRVSISGTRTAGGATIHVRSDRHPGRIVLRVRGAKVVRVNGTALAPRPARFHQRGSAEWQTASASGVDEMTVEVQGSGRIDAVAADVSWGLPAGGAKLIAARDASAAVPDQDGDVTVTRARASW